MRRKPYFTPQSGISCPRSGHFIGDAAFCSIPNALSAFRLVQEEYLHGGEVQGPGGAAGGYDLVLSAGPGIGGNIQICLPVDLLGQAHPPPEHVAPAVQKPDAPAFVRAVQPIPLQSDIGHAHGHGQAVQSAPRGDEP